MDGVSEPGDGEQEDEGKNFKVIVLPPRFSMKIHTL